MKTLPDKNFKSAVGILLLVNKMKKIKIIIDPLATLNGQLTYVFYS